MTVGAERWRCFVAAPIGDTLRRELAASVDGWRGRPDLTGLRWTDPDAWHVTLAFLGPVAAESVIAVVDRMRAVGARHGPMRLPTGGYGAFPAAGRAQVAWYGITDADERFAALAGDLRASLGVDEARPFRPHLTLARARREPVDLRPWLADASAPEGELSVDRMELMRSHLGRGPATYDLLHSVPLDGQSRG